MTQFTRGRSPEGSVKMNYRGKAVNTTRRKRALSFRHIILVLLILSGGMGLSSLSYDKGLRDGRKLMLDAYTNDQIRCNCCHAPLMRATLMEGQPRKKVKR